MKLTGKCKDAFLDYYWNNYIKNIGVISAKIGTEEFFNSLYPVFQNTLIIEFFDSVGIYIGVHPTIHNVFVSFVNKKDTYKQWRDEDYYDTRTEAINSAIKKANEIYNLEEKDFEVIV
jgi:hypothetical protein